MQTPPHNIDAEQSVLGACLISEESCLDIVDRLSPADFYDSKHRVIFEAISQLVAEQKKVDYITLMQKLGKSLAEIGGITYITSLSNAVPAVVSAEHHASIVAELSTRRRIIQAALAVAKQGYDTATSTEKYRAMAESQILKAAGDSTSTGGPIMVGDMLTSAAVSEMFNTNQDNLAGIKTPFIDLNRIVPILSPGDLVIVAGRPGMGKTSFGLQLATHTARKYGPAAVFSLEMSKQEVLKRMLSTESQVSVHYFRTGKLRDAERTRLIDAARDFKNNNLPIHVDDDGAVGITQIKSRARRIKGLQLIVIDYLQLMTAKAENRVQEISQISRGAKLMAKELGVPVVALAQLSRAVEQRPNKHPQLSDLRESGSLEQDADLVMFLYRDDYYNADTEKRNIAEVIVAKQRNGPTGAVELGWLSEYTKFTNLAKQV